MVKKKKVTKKKIATLKSVPRTQRVTRGKKKVVKKVVQKKKKVIKKVVTPKGVRQGGARTSPRPRDISKKMSTRGKKTAKKEGTEIGRVSGYFSHVGVAAIKLSKGLKVGDTVLIKGHTTDFKVTVKSMQIESKKVASAKKGDHIGIKVKEKVRPNDAVYLV